MGCHDREWRDRVIYWEKIITVNVCEKGQSQVQKDEKLVMRRVEEEHYRQKEE